MTISNFTKIKEFHFTFGLLLNTIPQYDIFEKDPNTIKLRLALIKEELNETLEAYKNYDFVEFLDGLGDILYVVYGYGASIGADLNVEFKKYCELYYGTAFCETIDIYSKTCFEIIKAHPNINDIHVGQNRGLFEFQKIKDFLIRLKHLYKMLEKSSFEGDYSTTVKNLVKLLFVAYEISSCVDVDMDHIFDLIHNSNMSKVCVNEREAEQTVEWYKSEFNEGNVPYDTPAYRKCPSDKYWIVYNKSTGKILKSINYKPVDLSSYKLN